MISFNSSCNNKATKISIGRHTVYFSYETAIGYAGPLGNCRVLNTYSRTTGKHFNAMGIKDFPVVDHAELNRRLEKIGE